MTDPKHPVWMLARIALFGMLAIGVNYTCANQFDADDWQRILLLIFGGSGIEGVTRMLSNRTSGQDA